MNSKVILYVEVDGQIWLVLADGSWQPLTSLDSLDPALPFITNLNDLLTVSPEGLLTFTVNGQVINLDPSLQITIDQTDSRTSQTPEPALVTLSDGQSYIARIHNDGAEMIAQAGYQTSPDQRESSFTVNDTPNDLVGRLALDAKLSVYIEDGTDNVIKRFEVPVTDVSGRTENIEDGWQVKVAVTDAQGNSITLYARVMNNQ